MFRKVVVVAALASAALAGLAGCTPPDGHVATPSASSTPSPAGTPEATRLETARFVYESYLNTRSALTQSYDGDPDALLQWATERQAAVAIADVASLVEAQQMIEGAFVVTSVSLIEERPEGIRVVACVDNSDVRLVDRTTGEATPATPTAPSVITLVGTSELRLDEVAAAPAEDAALCA